MTGQAVVLAVLVLAVAVAVAAALLADTRRAVAAYAARRAADETEEVERRWIAYDPDLYAANLRAVVLAQRIGLSIARPASFVKIADVS